MSSFTRLVPWKSPTRLPLIMLFSSKSGPINMNLYQTPQEEQARVRTMFRASHTLSYFLPRNASRYANYVRDPHPTFATSTKSAQTFQFENQMGFIVTRDSRNVDYEHDSFQNIYNL
jgi:hypothetical protein